MSWRGRGARAARAAWLLEKRGSLVGARIQGAAAEGGVMGVEMVDKSGEMRKAEDFERARKVVEKRLVGAGGIPQDVELFMEYTTIIEGLRIAEVVSRKIGGGDGDRGSEGGPG